MKDRDAKGRAGRAEKENNGNHILTESDVLEIRKLYKSKNYRQAELALMFGVDQTNISNIVLHKTWKDLNEKGSN
jgi:predicted XRE-type DNA-binding protein